MNKTAATLNDLVATLNDGIEFYDHAATQARGNGHRELFKQMSELKGRIAADLKKEIAQQGATPDQDGTWLKGLREGYADLKAKLTKDPDAAWIGSLEEQEDRILRGFRDAVDSDQPPRVRELANRYLPEVQKSHDRLRDLKRARAA